MATISRDTVDRLAAIRRDMTAEDFAAWAFYVLGMLGWQNPDVLNFLIDRTDEKLSAATEAGDDT